MYETTTRRDLKDDSSQCEGKISYNEPRRSMSLKITGEHGSFNMTAELLGQLTLSVRPPCVINLMIEQIGEVSKKNISSSERSTRNGNVRMSV